MRPSTSIPHNSSSRPYAFGSAVKERTTSFTQKYRYGFNNQEQEIELGEYYSFEYRVHDVRLGRFLSVDPLAPEYPWNSTYAFAENDVIRSIDLEGLEKIIVTQGTPGKASISIVTDYHIITEGPGKLTIPTTTESTISKKYPLTIYAKNWDKYNPGDITELTRKEMRMYIRAKMELNEGSTKRQRKKKERAEDYINKNQLVVTEIQVSLQANFTKSSSLGESISWVNQDIAGRGIIVSGENLSPTEIDEAVCIGGGTPDGLEMSRKKYGKDFNQLNSDERDELHKEFQSVLNSNYGMSSRFKTAYINLSREGKRDQAFGIGNIAPNHGGINLILIFPNEKQPLSDWWDNVVHENGHNITDLAHQDGRGQFEYHHEGLSSNQDENFGFTSRNLKQILNNKNNSITHE